MIGSRIPAQATEAVEHVAPIFGMGFPDAYDTSTWTINFRPEATEEQKAAAQAVVAAFDPHATESEQVNAERDRRLRTFPFGGQRYNFVDGKGSDVNVAGAGTLALAAIMAGAQPGDLRWASADYDFTWTTAGNAIVPMDAQTTLNFAKAAADWKALHIYAARSIKDLTPIPDDYADDGRWPS